MAKEMNKEDKSFFLFLTGIMIGAILYSILSFFIPNSSFENNSEFTIYKEECINESHFYFLFNMERLLQKNISFSDFKEVTYMNLENSYYECREKLEDCFVYEIEEVCETVEVEYMYLYNQTVGTCSKWLDYDDNTAKCIGKSEEWEEEVWLSSKDLTIEWLDENCECINACHVTPCAYDEKTNSYKYWSGGCEEYKCGNYIVEVKNG